MSLRPRTLLLAACLLALACLLPTTAIAATANSSGGASPDDPRFKPAKKAKIVNGLAVPAKGTPKRVVRVIKAANKIARMPYRYGGGHQSFQDTGYDCSGAVSFALRGGKFVKAPKDSRDFAGWGLKGKGKWITVYTNPGHAYVVIAGLRFDTSLRDDYGKRRGIAPGSGPRWGKPRSTRGFTARRIRAY
jgi:hypothetical protein